MSSQNTIYECSRKNAVHKISNSEWVNEWNDGIKLNKGDSVRLLGSFISELGDGNDISIDEDTSFSMEYFMYINADTVRFPTSSDAHFASSYQLKLGDIAQPAYATDNFGTEPPYCSFNKNGQNANPNIDPASTLADYKENRTILCDRYTYANDLTTPADTYSFTTTDDAIKIGSYLDTSSGLANVAAGNLNQNVAKTLTNWNQKNMTEEYYIAHLSKLCNFPMFKGVYHEATTGNFTFQNFDPNDVLKVGDYVSSYWISNYTYWVNENQPNAVYTTNEAFGPVKWEAGPQSVVGRVSATNYRYVDIYDPVDNITKKMEIAQCYVDDFINPSSYKYKNDPLAPGAQSFVSRHGRPQFENGYNFIKYQNRVAGVNSGPLTTTQGVNADGANYYKPLNNSYNRSQITDFQLASTPVQDMSGEVNMGLSFLWAGGGSNMYPLGYSDSFPKDVFTSWVKFHNARTGVFNPTGDTNATESIAADVIIVIDTLDDLPTVKEKYSLDSQISDAGSTFTKEITGVFFIEVTPAGNNRYRILLDSAIGIVLPVGTALTINKQNGGWYWYPRHFTQKQTVASLVVEFDRVDSDLYEDVGAIVRMNPDNDQVASYTPGAGYVHRLYVPYAHQKVASPYKVRNFGAGTAQSKTIDQLAINQTTGKSNAEIEARIRHNFGTSCAYVGSGDMTDPANRSMPVPYQYGFGAQPVIAPNTISGVEYIIGSGYNEPVLSVYFQNEAGDCKFPKPVDFTQAAFNLKLWKEDLLYIKRYRTQFTIPAGFYENQRMGDIIDDLFHLTTEQYTREEGTSTTTTQRDRNWTTGNNVLRGNFIHTYIPELSYGFFPETIAASLSFKMTTAAINDQLQSHSLQTGQITNLPVQDHYYYFIPYNYEEDNTTPIKNDQRIHLFRLIGAKLFTLANDGSYNDQFEMTNINPSSNLNNRILDPLAYNRHSQANIMYQNRGYLNTLMYGGQSKIWVGAVNPTFSFDAEKNLFGFSYLYTPYRPAVDEGGSTLTVVGGQAVPSAIVNAHGTGGITSSLSGIYIMNIQAAQPNATNTRALFDLFNDGLAYPTPIPQYVERATAFWNSLGFSQLFFDRMGSWLAGIPYLYYSDGQIRGDILRNHPELDISANGTNPMKSFCSLWAPALQFAVIVESNTEYGDSRPTVTASPFYLIGSNFPTSEYYGGKGTKLPIIGICSRQFSSFGYAFDLSESAVTLTIDQDCTITSIKTKIYNNDFTIPGNLDVNSSVIYVIERNNYYPDPTVKQIEAANKEIIDDNQPINYTPAMFEYIAPTAYTAPLYLIDSDDEDLE